MKRIVLSVISMAILLPVSCFAGEVLQSDYDYTHTYAGRFKSTLLFQRDDRDPIWRPTVGPPSEISGIRCAEALSALRQDGTWTGNLSNQGECLGSAEAPERTYGNYLNYLSGQ